MKKGFPAVLLIVVVFLAPAVALSAANAKITVVQAADKVTVMGGEGKKIASDRFALSKDAWYIVKVSYAGAKSSICQLSLATLKMITDKETVAGALTNWIGPSTTETIRSKGSVKSEEYMIYVEQTGGPWTVEILKNPKPSPLSSETKFSGTANKVSPFFSLKKGPVNFGLNQKPATQFSSRLAVDLYNADTGAFVTNLCHNATAPAQKASVDIPEAGHFVLVVSGGGSWDVSYTQ